MGPGSRRLIVFCQRGGTLLAARLYSKREVNGDGRSTVGCVYSAHAERRVGAPSPLGAQALGR